jgi:hypothetical protein
MLSCRVYTFLLIITCFELNQQTEFCYENPKSPLFEKVDSIKSKGGKQLPFRNDAYLGHESLSLNWCASISCLLLSIILSSEKIHISKMG